jgi:putative SOS response-associated peptidase YedK
MCGRFALKAPPADIAAHFDLDAVPEVAPRYNIAPTQDILIVRHPWREPEARLEAARVKWGLLPAWAKDTAMAAKLANARGETVAEKPAFRSAFRRMRCLVPADGFYEWEATPAGKQPWFLRLKSQAPLAFAGLWERWQGPDGAPLETATIITTDANALVRPVHDRMPVILQPADYTAWLGAKTTMEDLKALLKPLSADLMERYRVSKRMSNARNEGEECMAPYGGD